LDSSNPRLISQAWNQWLLQAQQKINVINETLATLSSGSVTPGGALGVSSGGTGATTASVAFGNLSPLTTSGDMLIYNGGNIRLPISTDGFILQIVAGIPTWVNPSAGSSPLTTKGDLYGYSTTPARIPVGSDTYVLTADSTNTLGVSWKPAGTPTLPVTTKGDILGYSTLPARIPVGADGQALLADSTQALGVKWGAAGSTSPLTTKGDLYGFSTINARIPIGTDGQVLTADSTNVLGVSWKGGGGNYDSVVLADAPAGYWKLNETSGTTVIDSSGNARNGTYTGGFILGKSMANLDGAVQLNGTSGYATIPYAVWMDFSAAWSVEAWIIPFSFGSGIIARGWTTGLSIEYAIALISGSTMANTSGFSVGKFTGSVWNNVYVSSNGAIFSTFHVVGTFDGTTMTLYINGLNIGSATYSGFTSSTQSLYLGRDWTNSGPRYFDGLISSCALYATSLSSSRILAHYNAGK
jgi:hypothetical protein